MGKIRNFLCFFICSFHLNCPTTEEQITDRQVWLLHLLHLIYSAVQTKMIQELTPECRRVVNLLSEGKSYKEVGELLHISANTVKIEPN